MIAHTNKTPIFTILCVLFITTPNTLGKIPDTTLRFQRMWEPKEKAFTLLVPQGWILEGGIFRINPLQQGGAAQSIEAKLDLTIKNNPQGTILVRALPEYFYFDMRHTPAAAFFPEGSNYNGMTVMPCLDAVTFITKMVIPYAHPGLSNYKVTDKRALPELAKKFHQREVGFLPMKQGFTYQVGLVTITYSDQGTNFKEILFAITENWGQLGAGLWRNRECFLVRTPVDEFEAWQPVFNVMRKSTQINTQWLHGELQGQIQRGQIHLDTQQQMQAIERQITEHRQKTNAEIQNDMFLTLTDQEEYVNPYTHQVETGSNQWRHRWVNESGDIIYSNDDSYDPRTDVNLNRNDYQKTPIRKHFPQ